MHLYVNLVALLLAIIALGLYVAVSQYDLAKVPRDERTYIVTIAWVLAALAVVVGVVTLRTAASPAEHASIRGMYIAVAVLLVANAVIQIDDIGGDMHRGLRHGAMWASCVLAVVMASYAALRVSIWARTTANIVSVRQEYRLAPRQGDPVGAAEEVLRRRNLKNRMMERMLKTMDRMAGRSRRLTGR